jgi:hypothetical protein
MHQTTKPPTSKRGRPEECRVHIWKYIEDGKRICIICKKIIGVPKPPKPGREEENLYAL